MKAFRWPKVENYRHFKAKSAPWPNTVWKTVFSPLLVSITRVIRDDQFFVHEYKHDSWHQSIEWKDSISGSILGSLGGRWVCMDPAIMTMTTHNAADHWLARIGLTQWYHYRGKCHSLGSGSLSWYGNGQNGPAGFALGIGRGKCCQTLSCCSIDH